MDSIQAEQEEAYELADKEGISYGAALKKIQKSKKQK